MRRHTSRLDASRRRSDLKLPKRHLECKTCGRAFCPEFKGVKHCQSCRQDTATGLRRHLPGLIVDQKGICPLCHCSLPEEISAHIHVDHRWPVKFGGTDDYENLQAVHTPCNKKKNATIELEGYKVVKDILRDVVDASRVSKKGGRNSFSITLDDDQKKLICRLWVKRNQVHLGVLDENKKETKNRIGSFDDIYAFAKEIKSTTQRYLADKQ